MSEKEEMVLLSQAQFMGIICEALQGKTTEERIAFLRANGLLGHLDPSTLEPSIADLMSSSQQPEAHHEHEDPALNEREESGAELREGNEGGVWRPHGLQIAELEQEVEHPPDP